MQTNISDETINLVSKISEDFSKKLGVTELLLAEGVLSNVISIITNNIVADKKVHEKLYADNNMYKEFINHVFYNRGGLIYKLQLRNELKNSESFHSFLINGALCGLPWLIKKLIKRKQPTLLDRATKYLNDVEDVLLAYNISKVINHDFGVVFYAILSTKNIGIETFNSIKLS